MCLINLLILCVIFIVKFLSRFLVSFLLSTMELQITFISVVFLRFLYVIWPKFAYRLKWLFFVLLVIFSSSVSSPYFIFKKKHPKNLNFLKYSGSFICWMFGLEVDIRVEGEGIDEGNGVVVSNHQSLLDIVCVAKLGEYYGHMVTLAKRALKYFFPLGTILNHCGYIFIDRTKSKEAARILAQKATDYLNKYKNGKLFIFPEGTRNSKKNEFLAFKKGAFKTAIANQVPIFPCVISPYYFLEEERNFGQGRIIIKLMKPIPTLGLGEEDMDSLIEKTRSSMWAEYKSLAHDLGVENCLKT